MTTVAAAAAAAAATPPATSLSEPERSRIEAFSTWFKTRGGKFHRDLYFANDETTGLSLFSRHDHEGQGDDVVAVEVPADIVITPWEARETIQRCFSNGTDEGDNGWAGDELQLQAKEWVALYVFLVRLALESRKVQSREGVSSQKARESEVKSPTTLDALLDRAPYIDVLPLDVPTPLHFSKNELQLLVGTPLYYHALECRRDTRRACSKAVRWLLARLNSDEPGTDRAQLRAVLEPLVAAIDENESSQFSHEREAQSWDLDEESYKPLRVFRWATTIVDSRAFPPRLVGQPRDQSLTGPILVPGLDAFNHARQASVTWTYHEPSAVEESASEKAKVTLTIHNGLSKGQQVFNSYGPKSNEDFLASYAFVDPAMQDDVVSLVLGGSGAPVRTSITQTSSAPVNSPQQSSTSRSIRPGVVENSDEQAASSCIVLPNGKKQHFWKITDTTCPPTLLAEVIELLPPVEQASDGDGQKEDELQTRGEALEVILELLEAKNAAFLNSQTRIDKIASLPSLRRPIVDNVMVYRKGQGIILEKSIRTVEREMNQVEEELNNIM